MKLTHRCGAVRDYCTHESYRIYFCSVCRKVIGAKLMDPEPKVVVDVYYLNNEDQNMYDEDNLKEWV